MKTLTKIMLTLVCVCLVYACSKSDDPVTTASPQNTLKKVNANGTGTISGQKTVSDPYEGAYWLVYCDNQLVDSLIGTITYHYEQHWQNGNLKWAHAVGFGEAVSTLIGTPETAEHFILHEMDDKYIPGEEFVLLQFNIMGDKGSHYVGTTKMSNITWELTSVRAVCPSN